MEPVPDPAVAKAALRLRLRTLRRSLGPGPQAAAAGAIARLAAGPGPLAGARSISGYLASDGEPSVNGLLAAAGHRGVAILLPRLRRDGGIDLVRVPATALPDPAVDIVDIPELRPPAGFTPGRGGILEPTGDAVPPGDLPLPGVVLAPAVALDRSGNRLGRGGGAYDRLIPELRALGWITVGVCHAGQLVGDVPREAHDQAVDGILTDEGFLATGRAGG